MSRKWKQFIRSERGDGIISVFFLMMIVLIITLITVTIVQYVMIRSNLRTAAGEVLQIMKVENGSDQATRTRFDGLLQNMGMNSIKVSFNATPKPVQRGDLLEVTVIREYNVFALKAVGVNYTVPITVHISGLAHKFYRMGE
jgi:transcriptional accessory protein Tex/SPT6